MECARPWPAYPRLHVRPSYRSNSLQKNPTNSSAPHSSKQPNCCREEAAWRNVSEAKHQMGSVRSIRSLLSYSHPRFVRSISATPRLESLGWVDKIKGAFTGKKPSPDSSAPSFSLTDFADQMEKARGMGLLKQFVVGRCSEATMADAFKKQSSILRYLGSIDPTGENLQPSHKHEATNHCNCTISEVEHILSKYKWAKDAQTKIDKLKEEGKSVPKSFSEVQKLMGSTPLDVARSNMSKNRKIGRNDPCSCGSGKKYKRCCGPP